MLALSQKAQCRSMSSSPQRRGVAWVAAFLLSLGGAGLCEAENSLETTYWSLQGEGSKLLTPEVSPVQESSECPKERTDLKAPQFLIVPSTTGSTPAYYEFVFWNINGTVYPTERALFYPYCGGPNYATAWYRVSCDPNPAVACPGGGLGANVYPFSLIHNKPITGTTAIESVTGAVQTDPNTVTLPSDGSTATVDLLSKILDNDGSSESFLEYQLDGGGPVGSRDLTVHVGDFVLAFYHNPRLPPPCTPPHCF